MKKVITAILLAACMMLPGQRAHAQIIILDIIKAGIKKVIKAVDLQVQRQQNKVIWLQNAQKVLENTMSKAKLDEISDLTEKQRTLYADYFDELNKVKGVISYYRKVRDITDKQARLVEEYRSVWGLVQQDKHFSAKELNYMHKVYSGMLDQSVKNLEQLYMAVGAFKTQMSDAQRLKLLDAASDNVDENYNDLKSFNQSNMIISLQRAKSLEEVEQVKKLYGLQ